MYIWNGYTVIGKHKDLTEGMLKTLDEAQATLESNPSMKNKYKPIYKNQSLLKTKESWFNGL